MGALQEEMLLDGMPQRDYSSINTKDEHISLEEESPKQPGCADRLYPKPFFPELRALLKTSAPLIAQQLTMYSFGPVAIIFCGHLGKLELDSVALASSFINVFGISCASGLSSACDTLFSQVYGSKNKKDLGIVLQRGLLIMTLAVLPSLALYVNSEPIFRLLGQDPTVAKLAGDYMLIFIPGTVCFYIYITLLKYIQCQNIITPTLIIGAVANAFNAVMHYLLLYVANYSTTGSAISMLCSYILLLLLTIAYIVCSGLYKETWSGWNVECLQKWGQFSNLAVFGLLMICVEWWAFEFGIFLAGLLGTVELGAQSVVFQIEIVAYMFPLGNGIAAALRVGQFLGSGDGRSACAAARIAITFIAVLGITMGLLLVLLRDYLPYIFSNDPEIIEEASHIFPIMGIYMLFDSVAGTCAGIFRGCGNQTLGAAIVCFGYSVALSIGVPVMFMTPARLLGLWASFSLALMLESAIFFVLVMRTDWDKQAKQAYERIGLDDRIAQENAEKRALLSSTAGLDKTQEGTATVFVEDYGDKIPVKVVVRRRLVAFAIMMAILIFGIILRVKVIHIDYENQIDIWSSPTPPYNTTQSYIVTELTTVLKATTL